MPLTTSEVQAMIATANKVLRDELLLRFDQQAERTTRHEKVQEAQDRVLNRLTIETTAQSQQLGKIEQRIIGIDGNGTGRVGAIQRIENTLATGFDSLRHMIKEVQENAGTYQTQTTKTVNEILMQDAYSRGFSKAKIIWYNALRILGTGIVVGCIVELFKHLL